MKSHLCQRCTHMYMCYESLNHRNCWLTLSLVDCTDTHIKICYRTNCIKNETQDGYQCMNCIKHIICQILHVYRPYIFNLLGLYIIFDNCDKFYLLNWCLHHQFKTRKNFCLVFKLFSLYNFCLLVFKLLSLYKFCLVFKL